MAPVFSCSGSAGDCWGRGALDMDALLCKSDFRRILKSGRGKSRRSSAMRSNPRTLASRSSGRRGEVSPRLASRACTAKSSCSMRERLATGTLHLRAQLLQSAELQLLYGSFAAAELLRNFLDAPLLDKTMEDNALLFRGKTIDEAKEPRAVFDGLVVGITAGVR